VKLKLDENLGRRCIDLLTAAGHDVATVLDQSMTSAADRALIEACAREDRALVTLDLDFSNPLTFPPHLYAGIAVLRLLKREELRGRLWSVEGNRILIYQPPPPPPEGP
jgi:hypothetical protein